ncbi:ArdC-like ssDNA-binding domain-containing protein [Neomoorella thermoacetica]|uniref:ArdC-like ssDNA-binding domain-containing protein n=1 Tax=Neomoorella thermoacetica TaxID=1525 RepID=UPI0008FB126E|nr:ArdC-like ssDNA-binding domain-containing protein [Moorella thermoacetica]APC08600.1 hypothetical protein MTJW_14410 [Moorella thermoacetica]
MAIKLEEGRVRQAVGSLLAMFQSGDLPAKAARTFISARAGYGKPSDKWSLGNRLLMLVAGTEDARSYQQWREAGRQVKKGAKAIYILAPLTKKVTQKVVDPETGEEKQEERVICTGFRGVPVFRYEDTEGEPLPQADYSPPELPPLYEVAGRFGVEVKYLPFAGEAAGRFRPGRNEIELYSHDLDVFFHELAHAVHNTIRPLKGGQHRDQELVAETVACVLCELYGAKGYLWHVWEYIKHYGGQDPRAALKAIMAVLGEVEEVLRRIFEAESMAADKVA